MSERTPLLEGESYGREGEFPYSVENPPTLEVLKDRILAVHATNLFPKSGIILAGLEDDKVYDTYPNGLFPSFRPTTHFALGELVVPHDAGNWDNNRFAIILPLQSLLPQLVNVFAYDTFIVGDLRLDHEASVLVPWGMEIADLPDSIRVVYYDPNEGLRRSVNNEISRRNGWQVEMIEGDLDAGSSAYIQDNDINSPRFFQGIFDKYPSVSFGSHLESVKGTAYRYGVVDQLLQHLVKPFFSGWSSFDVFDLTVLKSLIVYHLDQLELELRSSNMDEMVIGTFLEKKYIALDWVRLFECEIYVRKTYKKTLYRSGRDFLHSLYDGIHNKGDYMKIIDANHENLFFVGESNMRMVDISVSFASMPPDEFYRFTAGAVEMYQSGIHSSIFSIYYAIDRWLIVSSDQAYSERLDRMIEQSFDQIYNKHNDAAWLIDKLKSSLNTKSRRLNDALNVLRLPGVRSYLAENCGMVFSNNQPETVEDVIRAYPGTQLLFKSESRVSKGAEDHEAQFILKSLNYLHDTSFDKKRAVKDCEYALKCVLQLKYSNKMNSEYFRNIATPMNNRATHKDMYPGRVLNLYESLFVNSTAAHIWTTLGLLNEYQSMFSSDADFWSSELSLLQIYHILKEKCTKS